MTINMIDRTKCILTILPSEAPLQVVGMPFFVDYYSVHDPVNNVISWAPHTKSTKADLVETPVPTQRFIEVST